MYSFPTNAQAKKKQRVGGREDETGTEASESGAEAQRKVQ